MWSRRSQLLLPHATNGRVLTRHTKRKLGETSMKMSFAPSSIRPSFVAQQCSKIKAEVSELTLIGQGVHGPVSQGPIS